MWLENDRIDGFLFLRCWFNWLHDMKCDQTNVFSPGKGFAKENDWIASGVPNQLLMTPTWCHIASIWHVPLELRDFSDIRRSSLFIIPAVMNYNVGNFARASFTITLCCVMGLLKWSRLSSSDLISTFQRGRGWHAGQRWFMRVTKNPAGCVHGRASAASLKIHHHNQLNWNEQNRSKTRK